MPQFSEQSKARLATCDERLQRLFAEVIRLFDCTVLCGYRSLEEQAKLKAEGRSQLVKGQHNVYPSKAVDVVPYPIDYQDRERMSLFGGFVLGVAAAMKIPIRWGGDWNMNNQVGDNKFDDLGHFEIFELEEKCED